MTRIVTLLFAALSFLGCAGGTLSPRAQRALDAFDCSVAVLSPYVGEAIDAADLVHDMIRGRANVPLALEMLGSTAEDIKAVSEGLAACRAPVAPAPLEPEPEEWTPSMANIKPDDSVRARFFAKVDKNGPIPAHCPELGPCHVWTAKETVNGYGRIRIGGRKGKKVLVHRVSFFFANGRWPEPECCHHCDNRLCVNDTHLFEGTRADNMADMAAKGRCSSGGTPPVHRGERHPRAKVDDQAVRDMRAEYARGGVTQTELARRHGLAHSTVGRIVRREYWSHV